MTILQLFSSSIEILLYFNTGSGRVAERQKKIVAQERSVYSFLKAVRVINCPLFKQCFYQTQLKL